MKGEYYFLYLNNRTIKYLIYIFRKNVVNIKMIRVSFCAKFKSIYMDGYDGINNLSFRNNKNRL